ncbi:Deaminase [Pararobbsia alpina]|uniref:PP0621 family protein n=1 Tax=Pararobbsia alpina TaxID=621374 RepID=UPI0039A640B1
MSRFILLILIGLIANWWWRNLHRQRMPGSRSQQTGSARSAGSRASGTTDAGSARSAGGSPFSKGKPAQAALPEPMVRCAFCDTHLPVSEATSSGGLHFCHPRHAHDYAVRVAQSGDGR